MSPPCAVPRRCLRWRPPSTEKLSPRTVRPTSRCGPSSHPCSRAVHRLRAARASRCVARNLAADWATSTATAAASVTRRSSLPTSRESYRAALCATRPMRRMPVRYPCSSRSTPSPSSAARPRSRELAQATAPPTCRASRRAPRTATASAAPEGSRQVPPSPSPPPSAEELRLASLGLPRVYALSPSSGDVAGGTVVTVTGGGLTGGDGYMCRFGTLAGGPWRAAGSNVVPATLDASGSLMRCRPLPRSQPSRAVAP